MTTAADSAASFDQNSPARRIKMGSGGWAYSLGTKAFTRGIYRQLSGEWQLVGPLPYVLERLVRREAAGTPLTANYRLSMSPDGSADDVVRVSVEELRDGTWADRLQVALSGDKPVIAAAQSAIKELGEEAPQCEIAPRVHNGELQLPPADAGPAGYFQLAPVDEATARVHWQDLLAIATQAPKLAFMLAAAIGGLYIRPLQRQSFWVALIGDANAGKTSGLRLACALYGNPHMVLENWSSTVIAEIQELGTFGLLPAFRDELGTAPAPLRRDLESLIYQSCEGATRRRGGRDGNAITSAKWYGILHTSANSSLLGMATTPGIARRVVEIPAPITNGAAETDALLELAEAAYGWPLHWLREDGLKLEHMRELMKTAEDDIGIPDTGLAVGLSRNFAVAVAGAERLEEITGATGIRKTVLAVSRVLLADQLREIVEDGATSDERAMSALLERLASRPTAYPTRDRYNAAQRGEESVFLPRDIEGWDLADDECPGDVAILTNVFADVCADAKIENPRIALRELDKRANDDPRGSLLRIQEGNSDPRRTYKLRLHGKQRPTVYVFRLPVDAADQKPAEAPEPEPLSLLDVNAGEATVHPQDRNPVEPQHRSTAAAVVVLVDGVNGPVLLDGRAPAPCRLCGHVAEVGTDPLGPVHPMCALERPTPLAAPAPETMVPATEPSAAQPMTAPEPAAAAKPVSRPAPAQGRRKATSRPKLGLCAVLAADGLWLPGRDVPVDVTLPDDAAAAYRLAIANEVRALWFHPNVHDALGIPADRPITGDVGPATAVPHTWTSVDGYRVDAGKTADGEVTAGLAAWVNIGPSDGDGRRIGLVFPAYDASRTAWHTASDGRTLCAAVTTFADVTREPFYMSLNETSAAMVRKTSGDKLPSAVGKPPAPIGAVRFMGDWSRALLDEEEGAAYVDRFDLNAAEASVNTGVLIGMGKPERGSLQQWNRGEMKKTAGYVLANVPRQHPALDSRLPSLLAPWLRADERDETRDGPAWAPVETLVLLDELGVPFEPVEGLLFPAAARLLRPFGERLSAARLQLLESRETDPAASVAYRVFSAMYKSRIGDYNRADSRIARPDVRDAIIAKARANAYRGMRKIAAQSGRYPVAFHVDAAYYVSHDDRFTGPARHDAAAEIAPVGMTIGTGMGQWKHEVSVRLVRIADLLGQRSFAAKFDRLIDEKGAY